MKIQESKEKLPVTFITDFIKTGWDIIGNLKADKDAIKANYAKTSDIAEILQDIIDAYTVAVSRMTGIAQNKDYLDYEIEDLKEQVEKAKAKALSEGYQKEDVNINIDKVEVELEPEAKIADDEDFDFGKDDDWLIDFTEDTPTVSIDVKPEECEVIEPEPTLIQKVIQNRRNAAEGERVSAPKNQPITDDDLICDFDDVDISDRPMTDEEVDRELKKFAVTPK